MNFIFSSPTLSPASSAAAAAAFVLHMKHTYTQQLKLNTLPVLMLTCSLVVWHTQLLPDHTHDRLSEGRGQIGSPYSLLPVDETQNWAFEAQTF